MIYLGADHGGYTLKDKIKEWLKTRKVAFEDLGALFLDNDDDYPIFAEKVAKAVASGDPDAIGVLICRSGGGMAIAANKFPKIRAVNCIDETMAMHAKEHNAANILVLSADFTPEPKVFAIIETFLKTPFSNHRRHARRLAQITAFEKK